MPLISAFCFPNLCFDLATFCFSFALPQKSTIPLTDPSTPSQDDQEAGAEIRSNELRFDQGARTSQVMVMSAQEIIAELPKLQPEELRLVRAQVEALAATLVLRQNN
jgi:hypothetical protein